jgi:uncharacterized protein (DUF362 family)
MRTNLQKSVASVAWVVALAGFAARTGSSAELERNQPTGEGKGAYPGRVVWAHDPDATDWQGPGDGFWWEPNHTSFQRVDQMMSRALRELTGQSTDAAVWDKLFRHLNRARGKGDVGYRPGEKVMIKVNFVGMIWREGCVNPDTYEIVERHKNYMNTSPQVICALLRQLVEAAGVKPGDITVGDTLAYFVKEYYDIIHREFPEVRCVDYAGKFGRFKDKPSSVQFHWSSRPSGASQDYLPTCFTEAEYLVNLANLKAHTGAGVTLCAKNHMGSLIRWPAQQGYFDLHPGGFSKETKIYRPLVDLMGHAHLGGKTVLYLLDGLYSGKHPVDRVPRKWNSPPFNGDWGSTLLASQDPVAIDSVAFDFLWTEWEDAPRAPGVDDYLHEAAAANNPPSGTFYDPDHAAPTTRLPSLGVHEHWNNPAQKRYSRNLGAGKGIELVPIRLGGSAGPAATAAPGTQQ